MKNPEHALVAATPNNSLAPSVERNALRNLLTTDVMALRQLPDSQDEIDKLRAAIDAKLYRDFVTTRLSDPKRQSLVDGRDDFGSVRGKWDSYILEVAQQYGARLLLSTLVMQRVWSWQCGEKDGAHKLIFA